MIDKLLNLGNKNAWFSAVLKMGSLQNNHIQFSISHFGTCDIERVDIKPVGSFEEGLDPTYQKIYPEFIST